MRKYLTFLVISNLLTGCIYADGCLYTPQMVNCVDKGKEFPYIAYFQKKEAIGHTNVNERWNDVADCGGVNISRKNNEFQIKNERTKNGVINPAVIKQFETCMAKKGYVRLYYSDCGTQAPEWNTGKCNL